MYRFEVAQRLVSFCFVLVTWRIGISPIEPFHPFWLVDVLYGEKKAWYNIWIVVRVDGSSIGICNDWKCCSSIRLIPTPHWLGRITHLYESSNAYKKMFIFRFTFRSKFSGVVRLHFKLFFMLLFIMDIWFFSRLKKKKKMVESLRRKWFQQKICYLFFFYTFFFLLFRLFAHK